MGKIITGERRILLDDGVAFQVLDKSFVDEGKPELHEQVVDEGREEDHRSWYVFSPANHEVDTGVRAKTLYELFHKEAYQQKMYVKEIMLIDLLKMGNKKRYEISQGFDFITIPDFYKTIYLNNYDGIEAPSVLRWMGYVTGRYGVGFCLYVDDVNSIADFFGENFFQYYSKYLTVTTVDDK